MFCAVCGRQFNATACPWPHVVVYTPIVIYGTPIVIGPFFAVRG